MPRYQYPTSIRLSATDKRRLQRYAKIEKRSTAGLIQAILSQWLDLREKKDGKAVRVVETVVEVPLHAQEERGEAGREVGEDPFERAEGRSDGAARLGASETGGEASGDSGEFEPREEAQAPKSFSPPPRKYQE